MSGIFTNDLFGGTPGLGDWMTNLSSGIQAGMAPLPSATSLPSATMAPPPPSVSSGDPAILQQAAAARDAAALATAAAADKVNRQKVMLIGGAAAVVGLGAVGWFLWRRKHKAAVKTNRRRMHANPGARKLADELLESWTNGNRKDVVNELSTMTDCATASLAAAYMYDLMKDYDKGVFGRMLEARSEGYAKPNRKRSRR